MRTPLLLLAALLLFPAAQAQVGFINEIHYDNASGDVGEFVEVALLTSETPADYQVALYNGSSGSTTEDLYATLNLDTDCTAGASDSGYTLYSCPGPSSGIQNGGPDGLALENTVTNAPIEVLSYEGSFTIDGTGISAGQTTNDIGVSETSSTPIGESLQRTGGPGSSFTGPLAETPGALNSGAGQTALPVELVAFSALSLQDAVQLRWATASETNNAGFAVEMKAAGSEFAEVGFVAGFGTTQTEQAYTFTVEGLQPGAYAFRLRQVDFDGASAYSPEIESTVGLEGSHLLTAAYPNPAQGEMSFSLSVSAQQTVEVSVYDALGRKVATLFSGSLAEGETTVLTLDGSDLPAGTYLVRATGERFAATQRVTVVL